MVTDPEPNPGIGSTRQKGKERDKTVPRRGVSRRGLLLGAGGTGLAVTAGAAFGLGRGTAPQPDPEDLLHGSQKIDFYGHRQAGIETLPQAHAVLIAMDLNKGLEREDARRLLHLLTDDAARLTRGLPALADTEPELAARPARLTVTFGFGRHLVELLNPDKVPDWLKDLSEFEIDELNPQLCGGDLMLQLCGDDPVALAHARRMLLKDARAYASPRWMQDGFRNARGTQSEGSTMRNLFGQVDETVQPSQGEDGKEFAVWGHPPAGSSRSLRPWIEGGTSLVVRLISMDLDGWDELARSGKEASIGRDLRVGAPLTGAVEHDEPDFGAKTPLGFPVIEDFAHIRRAHSQAPEEQILRRGYNYDRPPQGDGRISDTGLVFLSYQADVTRQFLPIQQRLAEGDRLNEWTTPIGSAVFAIPPGCAPGGYIGDSL
ncbi:MAG: Dyp-type peroxidase [Micrococcaceae bacterium]